MTGRRPGQTVRIGPGPELQSPQRGLTVNGGEEEGGMQRLDRVATAVSAPGVRDCGQDRTETVPGIPPCIITPPRPPSTPKVAQLQKTGKPCLSTAGRLMAYTDLVMNL